MSYVFKPGEYKTKGGLKAVVLSDQYPYDEGWTLLGAVESGDGYWKSCAWRNDGVAYTSDWDNLMPPEEKRWMNVYQNRSSFTHENKQLALDGKCTDALGTIELTFSADKLVDVKIV